MADYTRVINVSQIWCKIFGILWSKEGMKTREQRNKKIKTKKLTKKVQIKKKVTESLFLHVS